jgi:hypothetical protein
MPLTIPRAPRLLVPLTLGVGMITFLWFSPDETGWAVIPLGVAISVLIAAHGLFRLSGRTFPMRLWVPAWVAVGGAVGAGAALATAALMLLKTGLHNHIFPDYPLTVIFGILARLPAWSAAGGLVGLAAALALPVRIAAFHSPPGAIRP